MPGDAAQTLPPEETPLRDDVAGSEADGEASASWILERRTWERGRDLLPAPILARVRSGAYWFPVQEIPDETYRAHYSAAFWAATRANTDRLATTPATCSLRDVSRDAFPLRVHGLPFPTISADRAAAGCEVMWNVVAAQSIAGGQSGSLVYDFFDRGAPPERREGRIRSGAYLAQPVTVARDTDDLLSATLLYPTAPAKVTGTAILTRRYSDADRDEDFWDYSAFWRRVSRRAPRNRYTAYTDASLNADDVDCVDVKLEDFQWRMIGQQRVLAPIIGAPTKARIFDDGHGTASVFPITAAEHGDDPSAPWHFVENLTTVARPVWIIEGTPRERTAIGKLVLYVDAAMYRPYWKLVYGSEGELTEDILCAQQWWRTRDGSVGLATTGAMSIVDEARDSVLLARYTSAQLDLAAPSPNAFTIPAMIEAAK